AAECRSAVWQSSAEMRDAGVSSQLVRIQRLTLAATVSVEHILDERFEFVRVGRRGFRPPLVFFQLMDEQCRQGVLSILRRLLQPLNRILKSFSHISILAQPANRIRTKLMRTFFVPPVPSPQSPAPFSHHFFVEIVPTPVVGKAIGFSSQLL